MLSAHKPDHPWSALDDLHFLRSLGGWRRDRASGAEGVTLAGLLMRAGRVGSAEDQPRAEASRREIAAWRHLRPLRTDPTGNVLARIRW
jgi:hypothetical protein